MRLTTYTDFSLRMLMFLALKPDGLATINEVAIAYGISKNHLMKVAYELGLAGYVVTIRGKGGGLRLSREPQLITLGEVVRKTEPDMALVPCFAPVDAPCVIFECCVLKKALREAREVFLRHLDTYTLADLTRPKAGLAVRLGLTSAASDGEIHCMP